MNDSMTTEELLREIGKQAGVLERLIRIAYDRSLRMEAKVAEEYVSFSDVEEPIIYPSFILTYDIDYSRSNTPWALLASGRDDEASIH